MRPHVVRQGDGNGEWIEHPAEIRTLTTERKGGLVPFGLAAMDNGEVAMMLSGKLGTESEKPVITFSKDAGRTWTDLIVVPKASGRPMMLAYLGEGKLTFRTDGRYFSTDYGRTWSGPAPHPPGPNGKPFASEGSPLLDRNERGVVTRIGELGWYYTEGRWPRSAATVGLRFSTDGARTWSETIAPPAWKSEVQHGGKIYLRGVSEGSLVRAADGSLVAALRTDMHPRFFEARHSDHFEGTAVSISTDEGKTFSSLNHLFELGRHHAHLLRTDDGLLVMTVIVRQDVADGSMGEYASHNRGCEAIVSSDHGRTWNLETRYVLDAFEYPPTDKQRYPVVCGHLSSVLLDDGHILTAYGNYTTSATLICWKPVPKAP